MGLGAVLRGDPADPDVVWLGNPETKERVKEKVRWPPGSVARFVPDVEVVLNGHVLYREGDVISGACRGADMDTLNIEPGA